MPTLKVIDDKGNEVSEVACDHYVLVAWNEGLNDKKKFVRAGSVHASSPDPEHLAYAVKSIANGMSDGANAAARIIGKAVLHSVNAAYVKLRQLAKDGEITPLGNAALNGFEEPEEEPGN